MGVGGRQRKKESERMNVGSLRVRTKEKLLRAFTTLLSIFLHAADARLQFVHTQKPKRKKAKCE